MNIMLSSAGRRVELMRCYRQALDDLGLPGEVLAADCTLTSSACYLADRFWQVPRCDSPDFIDEMLELALAENVRLLVPTIDSELPVFAQHKSLFAAHGIHVTVSSPETVRICCDKIATHQWLVANGFPTVRQGTPEEVLSDTAAWKLPLIAKPRHGSASKGVRTIESWDELRSYAGVAGDLIVQDFARGKEYTVNVFVSGGRCVCAVPHLRLETRGGEVSKAITVKHRRLMSLASAIAEALPGSSEILNIQCFLAPDGDMRVIEINARAGGGYPLAHAAGACYSNWILRGLLSGYEPPYLADWVDNLSMLRYDQSVIQPASELRASEFRPSGLRTSELDGRALHGAGSR